MIDQLLKALKRAERTVTVATAVTKAVNAVMPKQTAWDEIWSRWRNVPLSDLRGQHRDMLQFMADAFEKKLPPWKRWYAKSNGRWVHGKRHVVRPIRGIHIRTKGDKDCTLPRINSVDSGKATP